MWYNSYRLCRGTISTDRFVCSMVGECRRHGLPLIVSTCLHIHLTTPSICQPLFYTTKLTTDTNLFKYLF